jgi:hypothetical protein
VESAPLQADAWSFPNCIKSMVGLAYPSVGLVAAYQLEGDEVRLNGLPYPSPEVSGREAFPPDPPISAKQGGFAANDLGVGGAMWDHPVVL